MQGSGECCSATGDPRGEAELPTSPAEHWGSLSSSSLVRTAFVVYSLGRGPDQPEGREEEAEQGPVTTRGDFPMTKYLFQTLGTILLSGLSVFATSFPAKAAQAQINIPQAAATTCAVMAGQQKPDGRSFQYLLLLDEDLADLNPIALALYREVVRECPKAYLSFQQRKRADTPYSPGSLVNPNPTPLLDSFSR
jgi:hypothetical protein